MYLCDLMHGRRNPGPKIMTYLKLPVAPEKPMKHFGPALKPKPRKKA